ncbi:AraC-like ligand-binding domain-containing protein [Actinacidiphila paucisporea]|uniref:AraC-type DNA-binding protein n=1 Tax=Actinacidiphila paucisporea TaxID=310782 RepID=A0A1M7BXL9_9ACTN|nr:helix-turn-helix domain-containing protein [Actinacidiphila paucisporea]SHL59606.1 AraC-type DNA-binding protein [Actinacidiphila paucisporea]
MLSETIFRSDDLPASERFDAWEAVMSRTNSPMHLTSDHAADYQAHLRLITLGEVTLWPATYQQLVFLRTPRLIRQSDPEHCHLSLVLRGDAVVTWGKAEAEYGTYDIFTNDTSVPYEIATGAGPITSIGIEVPKARLGLPWDKARQAIGRPISGREGIGALVAQFATQVSSDSGAYGPADAHRLGGVLCDLVTAMFAHVAEADAALQPETRHRTLLLAVQAFIREHLNDPDLNPGCIAAAHYISRSHLHRLFRTEGTTVAAFIRAQRLRSALRDLGDPALAATPVHVIAVRWGFRDHATFTRAFRAAYGAAPTDYRHGADVSALDAG